MGLHSQFTDVSSESFPLFLLAPIANALSYLRSLLFTLLHFFGLSRYYPQSPPHDLQDPIPFDPVASGLAGLILLTEQLNLNRLFSYNYRQLQGDDNQLRIDGGPPQCVVCLNRFSEGDHVRKLGCQHLFHKECFDGWLDHMNFNCPLCRAPLVSNERVVSTRRHVAGDLLGWFSM